jgi:hypothetical protein
MGESYVEPFGAMGIVEPKEPSASTPIDTSEHFPLHMSGRGLTKNLINFLAKSGNYGGGLLFYDQLSLRSRQF